MPSKPRLVFYLMALPALLTLGLLRLSKVYHVKNLQNLKAENGWVSRLLTKKVFYESSILPRGRGQFCTKGFGYELSRGMSFLRVVAMASAVVLKRKKRMNFPSLSIRKVCGEWSMR